MLLIWNSSLLLGLRKETELLKSLTAFCLGLIAGAILSTTYWLDPFLSTYCMVIISGLSVGIFVALGGISTQLVVSSSAMAMANSLLSGYIWQKIPFFVYAGIGGTLLLIMTVVYSVVLSSQIFFRSPWVVIAWRASASWTVATAMMMIAFWFTNNPADMENWLENWIDS